MSTKLSAKEHLDRWMIRNKIDQSNIVNYDGLIALIQASLDGKFKLQNIKVNALSYFIEGKVEGDLVSRYGKIMANGHRITLETLALKYGDELAKEKWDSYCKKQALTNTYEYKRDKYGMTEEEFEAYNASRSVTLENLIKRHGEENGKAKFESYCKRQKEAGISLEYFQEKYGIEEGKHVWERVNSEKGITLENFKRKYGDELGEEKFLEVVNKKNAPYSKGSQELFEMIDRMLSDDGHTNIKSYFATKNSEFCKYDNQNKKVRFIDYVNLDLGVAIEYNGDLYHANPSMFGPNDIPKYRGNSGSAKKTASMIWEFDKEKNAFIESTGLKLFIVWESDFMKDKTKVAKEIYESIISNHRM